MRKRKIVICVLALIFSFLSSTAGWGFMGRTEPHWIRFIFGFCFNVSPLLTTLMIIEMFKKNESHENQV